MLPVTASFVDSAGATASSEAVVGTFCSTLFLSLAGDLPGSAAAWLLSATAEPGGGGSDVDARELLSLAVDGDTAGLSTGAAASVLAGTGDGVFALSVVSFPDDDCERGRVLAGLSGFFSAAPSPPVAAAITAALGAGGDEDGEDVVVAATLAGNAALVLTGEAAAAFESLLEAGAAAVGAEWLAAAGATGMTSDDAEPAADESVTIALI